MTVSRVGPFEDARFREYGVDCSSLRGRRIARGGAGAVAVRWGFAQSEVQRLIDTWVGK